LTALLVAGVETLRRQTSREFPAGERVARLRMATALAGMRASVGAHRVRARAHDDVEPLNETAMAQLERLSQLHRSGELDDAEFTSAKQRILSNGSPPT
jgi:hypothetical protein